MTVPTTSILGIFNAGRQGMFTSQTALRVAGQNIANVNTPGYSRQRVIFDPSAFGNGVSVRTVQQVRDRFLDAQLVAERERLGFLAARQGALAQVEQIFNEASGVGIATSMSEFFAALQDLTAQPGGTAERETVRTRGDALGRVFGAARDRLVQIQRDSDGQVARQIDQVNALARQIADLNTQIQRSGLPGQPPNELLDQRQRLLGELSELVEVRAFEDGSSLTVMLAGGHTLVEAGNAAQLKGVIDPSNDGMLGVHLVRLDGLQVDITAELTGGTLGGLLDVRDTQITAQIRELDRLAGQLVTLFNVQHRVGTGLDGVSDRDFFEQVQVSSAPGPQTRGGVGLSASAVLDQALLTFHDYEVRFHDAGGGSFTYDIVDTTTGNLIAAGNPYVPGGPVAFDGISITLDNVTGPPQDGDVLRVNTYDGAAGRVRVAAAIQADLAAIAAGLSAEVGDNRNALALADLESARLLSGGTATFADAFNSQLTSLGIASQQAERAWEHQGLVVEQVQALIDSVSGVSIDEESTHLIQFQRSFQASAKVIGAVDELLLTLLNMV